MDLLGRDSVLGIPEIDTADIGGDPSQCPSSHVSSPLPSPMADYNFTATRSPDQPQEEQAPTVVTVQRQVYVVSPIIESDPSLQPLQAQVPTTEPKAIAATAIVRPNQEVLTNLKNDL